MSQTVLATYDNGIFSPDERLDLPTHAKVRLTVELVEPASADAPQAWQELEDAWSGAEVDSDGVKWTREQLHDRR